MELSGWPEGSNNVNEFSFLGRLHLAHNEIWHIPYRFSECTPLRYLNLRGNRFKEFPKAVSVIPKLVNFKF